MKQLQEERDKLIQERDEAIVEGLVETAAVERLRKECNELRAIKASLAGKLAATEREHHEIAQLREQCNDLRATKIVLAGKLATAEREHQEVLRACANVLSYLRQTNQSNPPSSQVNAISCVTM